MIYDLTDGGLKQIMFKCFSMHPNGICARTNCGNCGQPHHITLCTGTANEDTSGETKDASPAQAEVKLVTTSSGILAINQVKLVEAKGTCCVQLDCASDSTFIKYSLVEKLGLKPIRKVNLGLTTMGKNVSNMPTEVYELKLSTVDGEIVTVEAYGIPEIADELSQLDVDIRAKAQRGTTN